MRRFRSLRLSGALVVGLALPWKHIEQSFSDDGGKTWEVNWITDRVRVE